MVRLLRLRPPVGPRAEIINTVDDRRRQGKHLLLAAALALDPRCAVGEVCLFQIQVTQLRDAQAETVERRSQTSFRRPTFALTWRCGKSVHHS